MIARFNNFKNSLSLRATLSLLFAQTIPIIILFLIVTNGNKAQSKVFESFNVLTTEGIVLAALEIPRFSFVDYQVNQDGNDLTSEVPVKSQAINNNIMEHVKQNNPNLWYAIEYDGTSHQYGRAPLFRGKALGFTGGTPGVGEDCFGVRLYASERESIVTSFARYCDGVQINYVEVGGLEPNYNPPSELLQGMLPVRSWLFDIILQIAAVIIVLCITPLVIYLYTRPIRKASAAAARIGHDQTNARLPTDGIFTEVRGLIDATNMALDRLDGGYVRERRFRDAIAHELRTPLTLLRAKIQTIKNDVLRKSLVTDVNVIRDLLDRILDFAKTATDSDHVEDVDLVILVREACAYCGAAALQKSVQIDFDHPNMPVIASTNRTAAFLILTNIINNAIKHAGKSDNIKVIISPDGNVRIEDNGPGMTEAQMAFINNEKITTPNAEGVPTKGIGLFIISELSRYINSTIQVKSCPSGGTVYSVMY